MYCFAVMRKNSTVSDCFICVPYLEFYINTYTVGDVFIADLAGKGNRGGIYPSIVNVFVLPDLYE